MRTLILTFLACVSCSLAEQSRPPLVDKMEASTWEWLLERADAKEHIERDRTGRVKWVGFYDEEKKKGDFYRGSLTVDEKGYVTKMTFNAADFTNDEFKRFVTFKKLESLTAWHNFGDKGDDPDALSGAGLIHLKESPMKHFNIGGSWFNDAGMKAANQLPNLRELKVYHTRVTNEGVKALRGNQHLTYLNLGPQFSQKISETCLEDVATIAHLEKLDLNEMLLSWEGGLKHLTGLKQLKKLTCQESYLSEADLERLRTAMPALEIVYEPADEAMVEKMRRREAAK